MRFLIDENVHAGVIPILTSAGHDAVRVPSGIRNGEVIALAGAEGRILVTHDKDFLDAVRYPPANLPGIICLRIHPPVLAAVGEALLRVLSGASTDSFRGKATTLTN